uniref:Uncharacterized protein n=1 Tax=Thermosporothrix sp. COM3 TaxID=2490863 RepID=A0A455SJ24_9CHLR|nr:hypothetical protein KTC_16930 [Thermosporothrix sp. COM3]
MSLFAGVWVDRLPRRLVLLVADIGQAVLIGSVPPGALLGRLLGTWLGLRTTLILVVAGIGIAFVWLLCSPVRGLVKPERTL